MPIPLLEQVESVEMDSSSAQMVGPKDSGGAGEEGSARSPFQLLLWGRRLKAWAPSAPRPRHRGGGRAGRPGPGGGAAPQRPEQRGEDRRPRPGPRAPRGSGRRGRTALQRAAFSGHVAVVRRLLEARAALDAKDNTGRRPQELRSCAGSDSC